MTDADDTRPPASVIRHPSWLDIQFCVGCNYQPRATALAATLREAFPEATVTLTPTGGGAFEVLADGQTVFSKHETGRHALPGEVVANLQALLLRAAP